MKNIFLGLFVFALSVIGGLLLCAAIIHLAPAPLWTPNVCACGDTNCGNGQCFDRGEACCENCTCSLRPASCCSCNVLRNKDGSCACNWEAQGRDACTCK